MGDEDVAAARASFQAAFDDVVAGGLAAKQAPAPVHLISEPEQLAAITPSAHNLPIGYHFGLHYGGYPYGGYANGGHRNGGYPYGQYPYGGYSNGALTFGYPASAPRSFLHNGLSYVL